MIPNKKLENNNPVVTNDETVVWHQSMDIWCAGMGTAIILYAFICDMTFKQNCHHFWQFYQLVGCKEMYFSNSNYSTTNSSRSILKG